VFRVLSLGMNNFEDPPIQVLSATLVGGKPGVLTLGLVLKMVNPSSAALAIGRVSMNIYYQGIFLGNGSVLAMNLERGGNFYNIEANYFQTPFNVKQGREFLSLYAQGFDVHVVLQGSMDGCDVPVLQPALAKLNAPGVLPGLNATILHYVKLDFDIVKIIEGIIPSRIYIYNPWPAAISIGLLNFTVAYKSKLIGKIDISFSSNPIKIGGRQITETAELPVMMFGVSIEFLKTILGEIGLDAAGYLAIEVGTGFSQLMDYSQEGIPTSFESPS